MLNARLFELGVVAANVLVLVIAIVIGTQSSVLAGVLFFALITAALTSVIFNFDYPLVRRLVSADDRTMLNLCRTGFIGRSRRLLGNLPSEPRCKFCFVPFGGIGKLLGIRASGKNPNYCRSCFEGLPTKTHEMELGVLFADIRGFTAWTESHAAGDATEVLSRFYALANEVLTEDDAFVEFVGDQVMALYLVEMPSLGDRTADVMLAAAQRLVAVLREQEEALPVGVGLNSGVAHVGTLAKGEAKDFTAVGDVINTGARLQSQAQEFEIVLSQSVYNAVKSQVPSASHAEFEVKGKAEPLQAYVIANPG